MSATEPIAIAASEIPRATGLSRRSAQRAVREIGHKVGARRIVLHAELVEWIRSQPQDGPTKEETAP